MKIAITLELDLDEYCAVKSALEFYVQTQTDVRDTMAADGEWTQELQVELEAAEAVLRGLKRSRLG